MNTNSILWSNEAERLRMIDEAKRVQKEINQIFIDVAHWNRAVRKPDELPIDADPDGEMAVCLEELVNNIAFLESEAPTM